MVASGTSLVIIAKPGWRNATHVRVGDLSVSWSVNRNGRLSCRMPAKDQHLLGFEDLKGKWIFAQLGQLPAWCGEIEDTPSTIGDQVVELNAVSMGGQLDNRMTPLTYRQVSSSPGSLIYRALIDSAKDHPLWIDRFQIDEQGAPITVEWRGEQLGRVVSSLANTGGGVWMVDAGSDRVITFKYLHRPRDRRRHALLAEGFNVVSGSVRPTISQMVNDLTGMANDRDWQRTEPARIEHAASIKQFGRRQGVQRYEGHTRRSSLEAVTRADVERLALPIATVSLDVPASNQVLREFQHGDVIRLWSYGANRAYDLTVTGRSYEPARGLVTIVGTAAEVAA